jgi:hypothetical protein
MAALGQGHHLCKGLLLYVAHASAYRACLAGVFTNAGILLTLRNDCCLIVTLGSHFMRVIFKHR